MVASPFSLAICGGIFLSRFRQCIDPSVAADVFCNHCPIYWEQMAAEVVRALIDIWLLRVHSQHNPHDICPLLFHAKAESSK